MILYSQIMKEQFNKQRERADRRYKLFVNSYKNADFFIKKYPELKNIPHSRLVWALRNARDVRDQDLRAILKKEGFL